jgi:2-iminobutanoate/2-iminopropanoate deaminase
MRFPGQIGSISGAVSHGGIVVTSGVIDPALLAGDAPDIQSQITGSLTALGELLEQAGSGLDHALRIEAFLAAAADFTLWNCAFAEIWPEHPPARTTLVAGFALPTVLIEIQAIAATRTGATTI